MNACPVLTRTVFYSTELKRKNIYETLSSNHLTYSAMTGHNFNIAVVPNPKGQNLACFHIDNSVLTKVDIHIFVNKLGNISN